MRICSTKQLAIFLLAFSISASRCAIAGYQDAVELQRKCETTGQFASSVFNKKKKYPNYFIAIRNVPKSQRVYFDPESLESKSEAGQVILDIYLAVYFDATIGNSKDAYMHGWSICMDRKYESE